MKSLAFATYWLMVIAVVGGIHSQHSEYPAGNFQPVSPELALYNSKFSCHSTHQSIGRTGVADAECFSTLRKLR